MARVTQPLFSQDARGSVSGIQYSRNRAGSFGSRKSTSNRKQSEAVTLHRSRLKLAHTAWLALDAGLQAAWDQYAGDVRTGRNAFVGAALRNMTFDYPVPSLSPLAPSFSNRLRNIRFARVEPFVDHHWLTWSSDDIHDDRIIVYQAVPRGLATPHVRKFRFLLHAGIHTPWVKLYPPYHCPWWALRILHWNWKHGVPIAEYRAAFPTDAQFYFVKDPP